MGRKRKLSAHQKQIRLLMYIFGTVMILIAVGMIVWMSRPAGGFHH
ncbi:MAG TPA: hypothetical protein VF988_14745 [Verrucomicrobiae bacterium]